MLTDGVEGTAFYGQVPEKYIDFDLGKECRLTAIGLYPYLAGGMEKGEYELYYWEKGGWYSLGRKEGDGNSFLKFDDVPANCLMMLKDCSKGWNSSERTFICREGGAVCWE